MEPVARGTLKNALCFHTIKIHKIFNWKIHVNPSWDEYKIFTYLLQLAEMFTYVNLVKRVYKNGGCMHSFHYPVSTLTTAMSASPFFFLFLYNRTRTTVVMHQALSLHIPALSTFQEHVIPSPPNLRVTFNNNLASCKNNTFVIVNFASCFRTQIIPAFKAAKGKCVCLLMGGALLSRGLFFL